MKRSCIFLLLILVALCSYSAEKKYTDKEYVCVYKESYKFRASDGKAIVFVVPELEGKKKYFTYSNDFSGVQFLDYDDNEVGPLLTDVYFIDKVCPENFSFDEYKKYLSISELSAFYGGAYTYIFVQDNKYIVVLNNTLGDTDAVDVYEIKGYVDCPK